METGTSARTYVKWFGVSYCGGERNWCCLCHTVWSEDLQNSENNLFSLQIEKIIKAESLEIWNWTISVGSLNFSLVYEETHTCMWNTKICCNYTPKLGAVESLLILLCSQYKCTDHCLCFNILSVVNAELW